MTRSRKKMSNPQLAAEHAVSIPVEMCSQLAERSVQINMSPGTLVHDYVERVLVSDRLTAIFLNYLEENLVLFDVNSAGNLEAVELEPLTRLLLRYLVCLAGLFDETSRVLQALIHFHLRQLPARIQILCIPCTTALTIRGPTT